MGEVGTGLLATSETETAAAFAAGVIVGACKPFDVGGRPLTIVPDGLTVKNLEEHLKAPARLNKRVTLGTPDSFAAYVKLFADPARSLVFADKKAGTFTAVLDYHAAPDAPSWCEHAAGLVLIPTLAWAEWTAANKQAMTQAEFATFVEDHIPDIVSPDGAALLELALNFEATKAGKFGSAMRQSDGSVDFSYSEEVVGQNAKAGKVKAPTTFVLALAPFEGTPVRQVTARFRYRIAEGGKLALWFDLLRVQEVRDLAFAEVAAKLATDLSGVVRGQVEGK